jgi:hypothetical protein
MREVAKDLFPESVKLGARQPVHVLDGLGQVDRDVLLRFAVDALVQESRRPPVATPCGFENEFRQLLAVLARPESQPFLSSEGEVASCAFQAARDDEIDLRVHNLINELFADEACPS